ncbi:MAG TPA: vWA domain-containing protein [Polyangiaceae bacterium]
MWRRALRRVMSWFGVSAGFLAVAPGAEADWVQGTRSEELRERTHAVSLTLKPGHAELVVQRTVFNGGPRHDQAEFWINLPSEAVAIGLSTLGSLAGRPHWFEGELLEAEAAAARYRELTGIGGYYPKDPALLSWRSQQLLALQVFPCPPGALKSVEYTLVVPTHYRDGAHHLELPALGTEELPATITLRQRPEDAVLVGGAAPPRVIRPEAGAPLDFALSARGAPRLGGELVTREFASGRVLLRYAAYAGPRLSTVPPKAHVVAVIDASLSTDAGFAERARAALDGYLSHFGDAHVEVLTFHRRVERAFGAFRPLAEARSALSQLAVVRKNGSDVDRALFEADRLLSTAPPGSARRIVLLTDGLAREGLTGERLRAATSQAGAVTHLGILSEGSSSLARDDAHPWAEGLAATRGVVWQAHAREGEADAARRVFEEWARPLRFHDFRALSADPELVETLEVIPPVLDEGQGVEALLLAERRVPWLAFEGKLWTENVRARLEPDARGEKLWSALVFGSPLLDDLSEPEMMTLALSGGAVSPVTSYLAIEPGVRPSTEGLDWGRLGGGFGAGQVGVRSGGTTVSGRGPALDRQAFLDRTLADDYRRCGGRPGTATVTFETTAAEIAHVQTLAVKDADKLVEACLRESLWALVLPTAFYEPWNSWSVNL